MIFNFDEFVETLHAKSPEKITLPDLKLLLNLGDDYTRDTPVSTGKRLTLHRIGFWGQKTSSEEQSYNNATISYTQNIENGVNIWIAGNFKGKSSIFKMIKFALTGRNRIKPNIKKWIHHLLLNFSINDKDYTVYLNMQKSLRAALFNGTIHDVEKIDLNSDNIVFAATSESKYEKQIEDFFFSQFSYYSLKWTQKAPQKDKDELLEAGASWVTYFESIFLESRDSGNLMFGAQSKKIFQMLLGLEFTYPINRLSVEKEKLQFEKARKASHTEAQADKKTKEEARLRTRLIEIDEELKRIADLSPMIDTNKWTTRYSELIQEIQRQNNQMLAIENRLYESRQKLAEIASATEQRNSESFRLNKEIQKTVKRIEDLEEFMQIGIFFSNLEVKHCPSCDHTLTEQRKVAAAQSKTCSLCNDPISEEDIIDAEEYKEKISNLIIVKQNLLHELSKLGQENTQSQYENAYRNIIKLEQEKVGFSSPEPLIAELEDIRGVLENERTRPRPNKERYDELIAERAVAVYKLEQHKDPVLEKDDNIDIKIQFLTDAITELNVQRFRASDKVLRRLGTLMLEEIRQLGLTSITDVTITEGFDVKYNQDGDLIAFEDIAEGEQLRAKIAFYLSLIQLDIENNFGRHTRFLILDSPAKEEADRDYMAGLSTILQTVDERFGENLQILIGTAERSLTDVVKSQYVTAPAQFVF